MLSYKKWKKINENLGPSYTLGLSNPDKIGAMQSKWDEMGMVPKMGKKKMFGGGGDDMGGGMDDMPMPKKKKPMGKPPMGPEDDDLGADASHDVDAGDTAGIEGDDDMGHEDDDMDHDDMDHDDDDSGEEGDEGGDDMADMGGDDATPPPMPMKKGKGSFVDKTKAVADGAKMMHKGAKKMIKGMKESKEDREFFASLKAQTGSTHFAVDQDGDWVPVQEDAIIPPSDPNANIVDDEPGPGDVGYAPQGKVGSLGTFAEWSARHKRN